MLCYGLSKDASDNLEDAIENCVDFINDNGGFTVIMWYSRGEINDKSFIRMATQSDEGQVDAGNINYHIIPILPKNEDIPKRGNQLNTELNKFKFKFGNQLYFQ